MSSRRAATIALAVVLGVAGCVPGSDGSGSSASSSPDLGALREQYQLPDCPATDPDAEPVDGGLPRTALPCLGSSRVVNLAGLPREPMVINLWAQWCGPCREESPYLREAHDRHPELAFIGINYNDPKPDWALEFASLVGWDYPHVQDIDKELAGDLGIPGIPMTLFVAADGHIVHQHLGVLTSAEQLEQLIEEYL